MKFCSYCGKQLNEGEVCTCPGAQEAQMGKKKGFGKLPMEKVKKLGIPVAILLVVAIAIVCVVSYIHTQIDLADYIVIEGVTGLNTQGVLKYDLDEDALTKALLGKTGSKEVTNENFEALMIEQFEKYEQINQAISCITLTASQETGLSNGDTVTVTATFENTENYKFNFHFKGGSRSYAVTDLREGKAIDPFAEEYVSVVFTGINGYGEAEATILSDEAPISLFRYQLSNEEDLSNGDSVILSVEANQNQMTELGYFMPETMKKIYTVSGLEDGKQIDPFAYVSVVFSGVSPKGEASVEILTDEDPISLFEFELSQTDELCNGDAVTLTANVDEEDLLALGYLMPETLEKTFTVSGLGEFFDIANGFPKEELDKLCDKTMELVAKDEKDDTESGIKVTIPSMIHGAYFLNANDPVEPHEDWSNDVVLNNAVAIVTSYTVEFFGPGSEREKWSVWVFPNYSVSSEGTLSYQSEKEHSYYFQDKTLEEIEVWFAEEYDNMTSIKLNME